MIIYATVEPSKLLTVYVQLYFLILHQMTFLEKMTENIEEKLQYIMLVGIERRFGRQSFLLRLVLVDIDSKYNSKDNLFRCELCKN